MMEIVATSDLIKPKPTYNPRIITSRYSPAHQETPSSPFNQYLPNKSSPHFQATSPRHVISSDQNTVKLPAVTIPFASHHGLVYGAQSPKRLLMTDQRTTSPTCTSASPGTSTPTTSLPTTPATPAYIQQPTPTRPTPKKIYTCKLCGKTFNNSGNFSRHQKVHTGEKPYRCEICGKAFTQSSTLKRHILSHSGDRSYKCQVCSKGYVDPWSLKKHMKNHGFNTYSHVQVKPILPHYKFHPPNVVLPTKAHLGGQQPWGHKPEITPPGLYLPISAEQPSPTVANFKSGGSAFTQVKVESKLSKMGFPQAGLCLPKDALDKKDEEEVSGRGEKKETLSTSDALALYMLDTLKQNIKHNQEVKDPESKENENIVQFSSASKSLPEKESEQYTCDKCGRSFNNINNFKTHQVIHAGSLACNGELTCHQCKAVFITKQQLQAHMTSHTSSYWCVYCERSFRNEYNFKQHQTVHTTLVQEGDKKYPTWLESFRQEMMTCVTSLDSPQISLPSMSTLSSISSNDGEAGDHEIVNDKRRSEMRAMKLKALMDIDPLAHAAIPKFCAAATSASFYSSAGSSYSAASLSAGAARSTADHYLHDARQAQSAGGSRGPVSSFSASSLPHSASSLPHSASSLPQSAGSLPIPAGSFAHPKPVKIEPNLRRTSIEESNQSLKRPIEQQQQQLATGEEEERRVDEKNERGDEGTTAVGEVDEEDCKSADTACSPMEIDASKERIQNTEEEEEEGKPSPKRARNITYQCCLCEFNDSVLSSLTSHLEKSHSLIDYELIKMLLACLGDIGT